MQKLLKVRRESREQGLGSDGRCSHDPVGWEKARATPGSINAAARVTER